MKKINNDKYFALLNEFETSFKLIRIGFGEIQNINLTNDFYFLPFQIVSQGFERFMKAYICLAVFHKKNKFPESSYLRQLGHDLIKLLQEVNNNYFEDYSREQFKKDKLFLSSDRDLGELLHILTEFGKYSRYYNFEVITGDKSKSPTDAVALWQNFENKIIPTSTKILKKLLNFDVKDEVYGEISAHIITVFEKFVSALSRQFIFNSFGELGKKLTAGSFYDFGILYDKDFGRTDYRKYTSKRHQNSYEPKKRTKLDDIRRKNDSEFKWRKIQKSEYEGDWPFYAEEIILECREEHWCVVTIGEYDYGLNGAAQSRYKLPSPHDAGMAILGKSVSDFIQMGLALRKNEKFINTKT